MGRNARESVVRLRRKFGLTFSHHPYQNRQNFARKYRTSPTNLPRTHNLKPLSSQNKHVHLRFNKTSAIGDSLLPRTRVSSSQLIITARPMYRYNEKRGAIVIPSGQRAKQIVRERAKVREIDGNDRARATLHNALLTGYR